MADWRGAYWVLVEEPEGKSHLKNQDAHGRIILKWISKQWDGKAWTALI
jgi:hypothetical protein